MRTWFSKKSKDSNVALTRFEAIALLAEVSNLISQERVWDAMQKIGMDSMPFSDEVTLDELVEIFQVRVADLAKYAGVKL